MQTHVTDHQHHLCYALSCAYKQHSCCSPNPAGRLQYEEEVTVKMK